MSPDDARHASIAGYAAGCRETCCGAAIVRYNKGLAWEKHSTGTGRKVPAVRAQRRIRALRRLGWSVPQIAANLGVSSQALYQLEHYTGVYRGHLARIDAVYRLMSMQLPPQETPAQRAAVQRARSHAERNGWPAPLAWDDIDTDVAPHGIRSKQTAYDGRDLIDEAAVLRVLSGDRVPTNQAERREALRRWLAAGKSERSLCEAQGWHEGRYVQRETA